MLFYIFYLPFHPFLHFQPCVFLSHFLKRLPISKFFPQHFGGIPRILFFYYDMYTSFWNVLKCSFLFHYPLNSWTESFTRHGNHKQGFIPPLFSILILKKGRMTEYINFEEPFLLLIFSLFFQIRGNKLLVTSLRVKMYFQEPGVKTPGMIH